MKYDDEALSNLNSKSRVLLTDEKSSTEFAEFSFPFTL